MSDYLRNVAARVLFPDRSVRPRVASVFEPQAGLGAGEGVAPDALDDPAPAPTAAAARRRPPGVTALAPFALRDDSVAPELPVHTAQARPRPSGVPQHATRPPASTTRLSDQSLDPAEPAATAQPTESSWRPAPVAVRQPGSPALIVRSPVDLVDRASAASDDRLPAAPLSMEVRDAAPSRVVETLHAGYAELQPAAPPVALTRGMGMRREGSDRHQRPADRSAAAGAPVHVTIGRVEVRASAPRPSRHPAAAPAPSGMTLDEYLRQRAGSVRR